MDILVATAGLGTEPIRSAAERVIEQSQNLKSISRRVILTEANLESFCPTISAKYENFLNPETRGYGFMSWKAELTYRLLSDYNGKALYFWVDAGCEVSVTVMSKLKFRSYIHKLKRDGYIYYCLDTPERSHTKSSLFTQFPSLDPNDETPQAQTTFFGLYGKVGLEVATRWFEVVSSSVNTVSEEDSFSVDGQEVKHRHDQSVFSLVLKEAGLKPNINPLKDDGGSSKILRYLKYLKEPVIASRNRSGKSRNPLMKETKS